jgi:hypothetical protein
MGSGTKVAMSELTINEIDANGRIADRTECESVSNLESSLPIPGMAHISLKNFGTDRRQRRINDQRGGHRHWNEPKRYPQGP